MLYYLLLSYIIAVLHLVVHYHEDGQLVNRDVLLALLAPIVLPTVVLMKLGSHCMDLDAVCYGPRVP